MGRQHFRGYPSFESLGTLQLRREDQCIQPAFVDEDGMVLSSERIDDVTSGYVVLVHHIGYGLSAIGMFQRIAHILCDKHHVTLFVTHGADSTEFLILKNLNFVHKI